ncbi:MAG TPA: hypothetical protein VKJ45_14470, partial [Blastocatellia bacterium]|nr:hypothetical protein [Blastocatellia bacterium]
APLEPGGERKALGATNIRLHWSREGKGGLWVLQRFGSAEAGTGESQISVEQAAKPARMSKREKGRVK